MDEYLIRDFIDRQEYNSSVSTDKTNFVVEDNNFRMCYGACMVGNIYTVIRKQNTWLLSRCIDGCGRCKACTDGVWVEETSGFIWFV